MTDPTLQLNIESSGAAVEHAAGPGAVKQLDTALEAIAADFNREPDAPLTTLAQNWRAWSRSHTQTDDIDLVLNLAQKARRDFKALVTVGIGGSDLSARVYHDTLNPPYHNAMPETVRGGAPEVYFTGDTFDPFRLHGLLELLEARGLLAHTLFNVISKSGKTGETISALMIVRDRLQRAGAKGEAWRKQVLATTGLNKDSVLFNLHQKSPFYGNALLPVPEGVGGRYSAFSPVGLFFLAATAGADTKPKARVKALLDGVAAADQRFHSPLDAPDNVAYRLARWLHMAEVWAGKRNLVFYNYADNRCLGDWFVQLYSESIQERGFGLNIISAKGPTSNHSILNGILNGPRDKVVLFIDWTDLGPDLTIPAGTGIGGDLDAFEGLSMSQVQAASQRGTAENFTLNGVPNATLTVPRRDPAHLGNLLRTLMDTVAIKGRLQNLHITDAAIPDLVQDLTYRQDGVEGYKKSTRRIAAEMQARMGETKKKQ